MTDNALATATPPAPSGATPLAPAGITPSLASTPATLVATEGGDGITVAQQAVLYSDLVARGVMTREAADKEIAANGGKPLDAPVSAAADAKATIDHLMAGKDPAWRKAYLDANDPGHNAAVARLATLRQTAQSGPGAATAPGTPAGDAATYFAEMKPASETDFQVPVLALPGSNMTDQEQITMARTITGALADGKFSKIIGNAILQEGARISPKIAAMTPAQRDAFNIGERAKLDRMWGGQAAAKIEMAKELVHVLDQRRPGIREMLVRTGLSSSAVAIAQIVRHAEALAARA